MQTYEYGYLHVGTLQHIDRTYPYTFGPDDVAGGIVYQGPHRAVLGQSYTIQVFETMTIWLSFNSQTQWNGGYPALLSSDPGALGWEKVEPPLRYADSISFAPGGKAMERWKLDVEPGIIEIPATTQANAVMCLIFSSDDR